MGIEEERATAQGQVRSTRLRAQSARRPAPEPQPSGDPARRRQKQRRRRRRQLRPAPAAAQALQEKGGREPGGASPPADRRAPTAIRAGRGRGETGTWLPPPPADARRAGPVAPESAGPRRSCPPLPRRPERWRCAWLRPRRLRQQRRGRESGPPGLCFAGAAAAVAATAPVVQDAAGAHCSPCSPACCCCCCFACSGAGPTRPPVPGTHSPTALQPPRVPRARGPLVAPPLLSGAQTLAGCEESTGGGGLGVGWDGGVGRQRGMSGRCRRGDLASTMDTD